MVTLSWSFGALMAATPLVMRVAMQPFLRRLATKIPPTERMARAMLKQIGLRHAVESGHFSAVEMAWFLSMVSVSRSTDKIDAMPRVVTLRNFDDDTLPSQSVLAAVTAPTWGLLGEDDPMGGAEIARQSAEHLPNAEPELMAGADHAPGWTTLARSPSGSGRTRRRRYRGAPA